MYSSFRFPDAFELLREFLCQLIHETVDRLGPPCWTFTRASAGKCAPPSVPTGPRAILIGMKPARIGMALAGGPGPKAANQPKIWVPQVPRIWGPGRLPLLPSPFGVTQMLGELVCAPEGRPLALNLNRLFQSSRVMLEAGPWPVFRHFNQAALDRILMHVV